MLYIPTIDFNFLWRPVKNIFRPALKIVEKNWRSVADNNFRLVKPDSLKRMANRYRQGNRPKEPLTNQTLFEVSFVPD